MRRRRARLCMLATARVMQAVITDRISSRKQIPAAAGMREELQNTV